MIVVSRRRYFFSFCVTDTTTRSTELKHQNHDILLLEARMIERVIATPAALELIGQLKSQYGDILFHQSGGCCDNSAANCYLPTDLTIGAYDIKLGELNGVPFYIGKLQYDYWKHTQLILDVIDGHGGTFSLEGATGKAFHTRARLFSEEEWAVLQAQGV